MYSFMRCAFRLILTILPHLTHQNPRHMKSFLFSIPLLASGVWLVASTSTEATMIRRTSSGHSGTASPPPSTERHGPAWHEHPMWNHPALYSGAPLWPSSSTSVDHSLGHGSRAPIRSHSPEKDSKMSKTSPTKAAHASSPSSPADHAGQNKLPTHEDSVGGRLIKHYADGSFKAAKSPAKIGPPFRSTSRRKRKKAKKQ